MIICELSDDAIDTRSIESLVRMESYSPFLLRAIRVLGVCEPPIHIPVCASGTTRLRELKISSTGGSLIYCEWLIFHSNSRYTDVMKVWSF